MSRTQIQRQRDHKNPTHVNVNRDKVPPDSQMEHHNTTPVNPISKYLRQEGNVKSDKNITRHIEVQQHDEADLGNDWKTMVQVDPEYNEYREQLLQTLEPHATMWDGHIGTINLAKHRIELKEGAKPVYQQPYRAGPHQRQLEEIEIKKMLDADVIEPAITEWAAPIVFAPKKDGYLRFCIDYRRLNELTVRDSYPIP